MQLINPTPFLLHTFAMFSKEAEEVLVVIMKGTYTLDHDAPPQVAEEQDPFVFTDVYAGKPGESGVLLEGDFLPPRPSTGITLTGHAVALTPDTRMMPVSVKVGECTQQAVIYGDRHWQGTPDSPKIPQPEPFERLPLIWENAFGGIDSSPADPALAEFQASNPVGRGFFAVETRKERNGSPLPNIEHPGHLIAAPTDRPPPVGFCPVAPNWQPRLAYAGTYDDRWLSERAPLLPLDFDERFYQTAPPELTAPTSLPGGEHCLIIGTTTRGRLEFYLPAVRPRFRIHFPDRLRDLPGQLDSVHIDTDSMRLHLVWRASTILHGRLEITRALEAMVKMETS